MSFPVAPARTLPLYRTAPKFGATQTAVKEPDTAQQEQKSNPSTVAKPSPADTVQILKTTMEALANRHNGLVIANEREQLGIPGGAISGGLGRVMRTIPEFWTLYGKKDVRVIHPYLKQMQEHDEKLHSEGRSAEAYHSSGVHLQVPLDGEMEDVEVMQRFEPARGQDNVPPEKRLGSWVYALKNHHFSEREDMYTYKEKAASTEKAPDGTEPPMMESDPSFSLNMLLTKSAAQLWPMLEKGAPRAGADNHLKRFDGPLEFAMANDWMTGAFHLEAQRVNPQYEDRVRKIGMAHNDYDEPRNLDKADKLGMAVPKDLRANNKQYSPLELMLRTSDVLVANHNYVRSLKDTNYANGKQFIEHLRKKWDAQLVVNMHHALDPKYQASNNEHLRTDGYTELKPGMSLAQFKTVNKAALQKELGLNPDPKAVIVGWTNRLTAEQKGWNLVRDSIIGMLRKYPNMQLVIGGNTDDSRQKAAIQKINQEVNDDPALKGRLYLPNQFVNNKMITRINSGINFTLLPSLREPYGLSQLEAGEMGASTIGHARDGIKSTVSDPQYNGEVNNPHEREVVWDYGQTGVLMRPIDVVPYVNALYRQSDLDAKEDTLKHPKNAAYMSEQGFEPKEPQEFFKPLLKMAEVAMGPEKDQYSAESLETLKKVHSELKKELESEQPILRPHVLPLLRQVFDPHDLKIMESARESLTDAVDRAMTLHQEGKHEAVNEAARKYVREQHTPQKIAERYEAAINGTRSNAEFPEIEEAGVLVRLAEETKAKLAAARHKTTDAAKSAVETAKHTLKGDTFSGAAPSKSAILPEKSHGTDSKTSKVATDDALAASLVSVDSDKKSTEKNGKSATGKGETQSADTALDASKTSKDAVDAARKNDAPKKAKSLDVVSKTDATAATSKTDPVKAATVETPAKPSTPATTEKKGWAKFWENLVYIISFTWFINLFRKQKA